MPCSTLSSYHQFRFMESGGTTTWQWRLKSGSYQKPGLRSSPQTESAEHRIGSHRGVHIGSRNGRGTAEALASSQANSVPASHWSCHRLCPIRSHSKAPLCCSISASGALLKSPADSPVETIVRLYLCRDRFETLQAVLRPRSLVVIGGRRRWWPTSGKASGPAVAPRRS